MWPAAWPAGDIGNQRAFAQVEVATAASAGTIAYPDAAVDAGRATRCRDRFPWLSPALFGGTAVNLVAKLQSCSRRPLR